MVSAKPLLVLLLITALVSATTYTFDVSQEVYCQAPMGCPFTNLTLWGANVTSLPAQGDAVEIIGSGNYSILIYLPSTIAYTIGTLTVTTAEFMVQPNSSLLVNSFTVSTNSSLAVSGQFNSTGGGNIWGYVNVAQGSMNVMNTTQLYGSLAVAANATASLSTVVFAPVATMIEGTLTIMSYVFVPNTMVSFPNGLPNVALITIPQGATVMISGDANLSPQSVVNGALILQDAVSNTGSISGNGSISLIASAVNIFAVQNTTAVFNGSVTLANNSILLAENVQIYSIISDNSQVWANKLSVAIATIGANALWNANNLLITSVGDLLGTLEVPSGGILNIGDSASVVATGTAILNITNGAQIILGGSLSAAVMLASNVTMTTTGSDATIRGNVVNHGHLVLSGDHPLTVYGNFAHDGVLDVTLSGDNDYSLRVMNGSLAVNGPLRYNMEKKPFLKNEKFLVVQLLSSAPNATITGRFMNDTATALQGSSIDRNLKVEYTATAVYVLYGFKVKDAQWWVWLVGALAIVVVVAAIGGIVWKCRAKRRDYQAVA